MDSQEFKQKLSTSLGLQTIVAGMARLVEDEGYTPHQVFEMMTAAKQNTFHALAEIHREVKKS
ncbi:hypothetical protein [Lysinibacillus fusiformis]|uniref:hypothetical protein n=1 Tax=Lysinibacillus fusiformis TaxID=28031 RepID=UPI000D3889A4|nr:MULTISPECIES: hypothetical protein [Lysinibacillus]MED4668043.1 hypothetical protein [Lysinibacillus fusiformis]QAS58456.1 hypothetical protein LSP_20100 [Lysinibacillus sphaericus]RDV35546.1 hypothetical protein C7B90_03015 [Lysinibacillus fusiformis]GED64318.1 hypothetical protein LFU01_27700 [Lysinibacillus fusiformis]